MNDFKIWRDKNIVILGINRLEWILINTKNSFFVKHYIYI